MQRIPTLLYTVLLTATAQAFTVQLVVNHEQCGNSNGSIVALINGELQPPYTFQ